MEIKRNIYIYISNKFRAEDVYAVVVLEISPNTAIEKGVAFLQTISESAKSKGTCQFVYSPTVGATDLRSMDVGYEGLGPVSTSHQAQVSWW